MPATSILSEPRLDPLHPAMRSGASFRELVPLLGKLREAAHPRIYRVPDCGSTVVDKAIMAPAVARTDLARSRAEPEATPAPAASVSAPTAPVAKLTEGEQEFRRMLRELREHVTRNADYVGDDFADLARKMHDGEVEHRSIYGEATPEDVKALREDEWRSMPFPSCRKTGTRTAVPRPGNSSRPCRARAATGRRTGRTPFRCAPSHPGRRRRSPSRTPRG